LCDIEIEYIIKEKETVIYQQFSPFAFNDINIGRVPIMLHSTLCPLSGVSNEMLKKLGECPYDHGGYFIINGREKVCVSRERKSENTLYINKSGNPDFLWSAEVKSVPAEFRYARNTYLHVVEKTREIMVENPYFKSGKSDTGGKFIPLFVLFRVLGIETDKEIFECIFHNTEDEFAKQGLRLLETSMDNEDSREIFDQITALNYLEKFTKRMDTSEGGDIQRNRVERYAVLFKNIYDNLYPHVGNDFKEKALYLGYCVNQLLQVMMGIKEEVDRDSFEYKRIDLSGYMIANLFRDGYKQLQYDVRNKISAGFEFGYIELKGENIVNIVNDGSVKTIFSPTSTEEIVIKGFQTGTLSNPGGTSSKKGVIQQIDRRGYYSYLGQIRRLVTPNDTGARVPLGQRFLHASQYGYMCPMTIMDGTNVGIKKHFTCLAQVTTGCPSEPIKRAIDDAGLIPLGDLHPRLLYKQTKVFLNGRWIGVHSDPQRLVEWIRLLRRNGLINIYTSVSWKIKEDSVIILSEGGRCTRPLYILENNMPMITEKMIREIKSHGRSWMDLIVGFKEKNKKIPYIHNEYYHPHTVGYSKTDTIEDLKKHSGVIEYLDNNDMNNVMVTSDINLDSKFVEYTHAELHASMMLSLEAQGIPFAEYNQLPRNVYGIGQSKQAISVYATNFMHRIETTGMVLSHPQKPLNNTRLGKHIYNDRLGHGQHIIVAVSAYTGYNQEDSVICCQDSIDLGMLKISYAKGYEQTEKQDPKTGTFEFFYNPETQNMREDADKVQPKERNDYSKLDQFGLIREGTHCKGDEIAVGKYVKFTRTDDLPLDMSVEVHGKGETIDKVFTCYTDDTKTKLAKIRAIKERPPMIGDKIGSRYGQKGVLGITLSRADMPHTKSGIRPDIIINPGAFPKRMTNGHLIETAYSKLCALLGLVGDGTAFVPKNMEDLAAKLEEYGFEGYGNEILYDGFDGQQMGAHLFIGPVFYQRFKQMVGDKIHSRGSGARNEEDLTIMGGGYTARERQPTAGRANGGGGRIGEMERDSIVAHGIAGFLKETMMERSDKYYTHICQTSGRLSIVNQNENLFISPDVDGPMNYDIIETLELDKHENKGREIEEVLGPNTFKQSETEFFRAYMPYCAKLMIQECEAMGISIKLRSEKSTPRLEEERIKSNEFVQAVSSKIVNKALQMDEDFQELESLKLFLRERYGEKKDKEGDEAEDEDKDKDKDKDEDKEEIKDQKNLKIKQSGGDWGENGADDMESVDLEMEEFIEVKSPSFEESSQSGGSRNNLNRFKQSGGGHNNDVRNFYLEEKDHNHVKLSLEDSLNSSLFETDLADSSSLDNNSSSMNNNQSGGNKVNYFPSDSSPNELTDISDLGKDLLGSSANPKGDAMSSSLQNLDRPNFPPQSGGGDNKGSNESSNNGSNKDIKIINLDPNYRMAEDDSFGGDEQSGGSKPLIVEQHATVPPPSQENKPAFLQHPPSFDNEIFI
jgi:DNA-directed RNA polymerase II subunit RPB2